MDIDKDKLEAGRELDALIEKHITNRDLLIKPEICPNCGSMFLKNEPKPYSTDIAAAWEMEEEIAKHGLVALYVNALFDIVTKENGLTDLVNEITDFLMVHANPLQRCKAALRAVMK